MPAWQEAKGNFSASINPIWYQESLPLTLLTPRSSFLRTGNKGDSWWEVVMRVGKGMLLVENFLLFTNIPLIDQKPYQPFWLYES
ncbi:MAG TPA: hypothetical protein VFV38_14630 [Ktedonobacteraceae bacterium]|nr:hypothetical protein [Ktedonobacteraceae bacterium]